jgi:hypothetical protein
VARALPVTANWDDLLKRSGTPSLQWRFTPIDRLTQKLEHAACYADGIINWGYFPYMDPEPLSGAELPGQKEAYDAYLNYLRRVATNR